MTGESSHDGRRWASVRCSCGRTKDVLADSLLAGRTKSCGHGACKAYSRIQKDPDYRPQPPRACSVETVGKAWARYHHAKPAQRRTVQQLAEIHGVNVNTLTTIFRAVRRCGGIKAYLKAVAR